MTRSVTVPANMISAFLIRLFFLCLLLRSFVFVLCMKIVTKIFCHKIIFVRFVCIVHEFRGLDDSYRISEITCRLFSRCGGEYR